MTASLPDMLWTERLDRMRAVLAVEELDCLLVSHAPNVRYLTGFAGAGYALVSPDRLQLVTDERYEYMAEQAARKHGGRLGLTFADLDESLRGFACSEGSYCRIGLEAAHLSYRDVQRLIKTHPSADFRPTTRLVETLRLAKDEGEVARIALAARIADDSLASTFEQLGPGASEKEFAETLRRHAVDRGSEGSAFRTIVASGPNAGYPHSVPTERVISQDEAFIVDFGCLIDGYRSDMTRTLWYGRLPTAVASAYDACLEAHAEALSVVVSSSATYSGISKASDDALQRNGYPQCPHPVGHHVGLEIHERPYLSHDEHDLLPRDSVVTIEPGIYLKSDGGVRVEDTVFASLGASQTLTLHPIPNSDDVH